MATELKKRSQVSIHETWNLGALFTDWHAWEKTFAALPDENTVQKTLDTRFRGKLSASPEVLLEALDYRNEFFRPLRNMSVYAYLRNAEDVGDATSSEALSRIQSRSTVYAAMFSFYQPEMIAIKNLEDWKNKSPLNKYEYELSDLIRSRKHLLSEKEEMLLTKLSEPLSKFREIHSKWNNVDLKFPDAKDSEGKEHLVTHGRLNSHYSSKDRTLRKNVYNSYYGEVSKWRNTIAANFYGHILKGCTVAKIRNYNSFIEQELDDDNIPVSVYDALISETRKHLSTLHKSMSLRAKVLKIEKVAPYDRSVSLAPTQEKKFTWQEACDLILASLAPMGDEYLSIAKKGLLEDRWADYAENEGKRSGAFSYGTYDSPPYLLLTWGQTLNDVFTLAHELGHSMHTYLANKAQPYHLASYTIFVAEVASTLNEQLLGNHILATMPESDLARDVLSHRLNSFEGTMLRQTQFAAFERNASQIVDEGMPLSADKLDEIYLSLLKEWYGDNSEYPSTVAHEWMRIPHFYSTFYVYKYATSLCASLALTERLKTNPKATQESVLKMLKSGGSAPPLDIMKEAGIDFLKPETVQNAFQSYKQDLDIAERLFCN